MGLNRQQMKRTIGHFDNDDLEKTISIIWFPGCKIYVVATDRIFTLSL